jgi:hypothetical protein
VETCIAEAADAWQRAIPEKLVHCLWAEQCWRPATLRTVDGREVTVHTPGRWNVQAGPDFQHAVITVATGERCRGDVEIHRYASGWSAHGHQRDARYNGVILHVFLWQDRAAPLARRADGQDIPQVALAPLLPRPLSAYQADIVLEDYPHQKVPGPGRCYATLQQLSPAVVQAFLERAGDTRLQQRLGRWSSRGAEVGWAQVMYEAVLRSLGSTGHRQHFQALARLVPWQTLQSCLAELPAAARTLAAEALLLGLAGLLPASGAGPTAWDSATRRYVHSLQQYWSHVPGAIRQRAWRDVNWRQPNVRPANTPERRLAGMAHLLAAYSSTTLLDAAVAACRSAGRMRSGRDLCRALSALCTPVTPSYWTQRAHLGSRPSRDQRLIGPQRALTVAIDAVLPVLLLYAQQQVDADLRSALMTAYHLAPCLPDNYLLRYMARRLLGNDPALLALVTGARHQQGILQILTDFCGNDEGNCQGCEFPLLEAEATATDDGR